MNFALRLMLQILRPFRVSSRRLFAYHFIPAPVLSLH